MRRTAIKALELLGRVIDKVDEAQCRLWSRLQTAEDREAARLYPER